MSAPFLAAPTNLGLLRLIRSAPAPGIKGLQKRKYEVVMRQLAMRAVW